MMESTQRTSFGGNRSKGAMLNSGLIFALCAAALAGVSLAGWISGLHTLTSFLSERPALSPMTAMTLVVAATAAALVSMRRSEALSLGFGQTAVGIAIVVSHGFGLPASGVFPQEWWSSQLTGVLFFVSGAAAVLLSSERLVAGQVVAFGVLMLSALLGLGHLFPDADLYSFMPGTGVAIPTVISFAALSLSLLLARKEQGLVGALTSRGSAGRAGRFLPPLGLIGVLVLAVLVIAGHRYAFFDAETAILLVAWGACAALGGTLWSLAVAVDRADAARKVAERERDEMRHLIAAAVTHDLRSPLQTATMLARLLQELAPAPQALAVVQRLQRSHRRLDRLLRSLLNTLSLDAGRSLTLRPSLVELSKLVATVKEENEATLASRVAVDGDASGWWDHDALFRVVENLLLNAVKYGERGTTVWCRITVKAEQVELTVENRGDAIDKADWDLIFHPFARGQGVDGGRHDGWGVGLSFARAVAVGHGGNIRLSASDGERTVFSLQLPLDSRRFVERARLMSGPGR